MIRAAMTAEGARGEGIGVTFIEWLTAVLYNGLGRYSDALAAASTASRYPEELQSPLWLHELVEAAARSGEPEQAADALEELSQMTGIIGTDWALGIEARSRALVSDGEAAERFYRTAIEHLARTEARVELARAHLVYGEWLRQEGRRADARDQLRTSHDMLSSIGADAFTARAARELAATGESVRGSGLQLPDELSLHEAHIARLAADGQTSAQIGAELFISPRTVDWHLRKVFTKLGINSRKQLGTALPDAQLARVPAS
jgi:DNA-binding CsgD family transcriptional regulator